MTGTMHGGKKGTSYVLKQGPKWIVEKLWHEFFSDPFQWWDNRAEKVNPRYPDFKHKTTKHSLWVVHNSNPPWVEAKLAALSPGTLQVDLFTWNKRLARYLKTGECRKTLEVFWQMQQEGVNPNTCSFVPVLKACGSLKLVEEGRVFHEQIVRGGFERDVYMGNCLIDMYAKCGCIDEAWGMFSKMPTRNVVSWSIMILSYVKCGQGQKALDVFHQMQLQGVVPDPGSFVGVLNACASVSAIEEGKRVHEQIIQRGYDSDMYVSNSLIDMYAKCGSLEDAQKVFNKLSSRTVVSWSAMILGYVKCGKGQKALDLFEQMQQEAVDPDRVTFLAVLNACADLEALEEGRHVHEQITQRGYASDLYIGNSLIDMYAKCGSIEDAWREFNKLPRCSVAAWNAMVLGYVKCGEGQKALGLYRQMHDEGVEPSPVTFVGLLNACASIAALEEGRLVHKQIIQQHCDTNTYVGNSLIDMYAKCGSMGDSLEVFNKMIRRDMVSWNAMLAGYAMHGLGKEACAHFQLMCQEAVEIDWFTFVSLLSACSHGGLVDEGLQYFGSMSPMHILSPTIDHYACVVDLLGRAGRLHEAEYLIKTMPFAANASIWRSLLGACRVHGNLEMAELVANRVLELDPGNSAVYLLLSNMYTVSGKLDRIEAGKQIETTASLHLG